MAIGISTRYAILILILHSVTAIMVFATALPIEVRVIILVLILLSLIYYLIRDVLRVFSNSWCRISLDREGATIVTRDGRVVSGHIEGKTFVCPHFVVLRIMQPGHLMASSRIVFPDAMSKVEFRELCVRLKFA